MIKTIFFLCSFAGILFMLGCKKAEPNTSECDRSAISGAIAYQSALTDPLTVNNLTINGNCLTINFSSSGCNGDSWQVHLVDAGSVFESNPPQRNLKFSLKNEEMCEAYITKEISFDISSLQVEGSESVLLNIINTSDEILYSY